MNRIFTMFLLVVLCGSIVFGQNISSSVKGTAVDPTGAPVPNGNCTLTDQTRGTVFRASLGEDGIFTFPNLLPGTYTLSIQAPGFKVLVTKNITVSASEIHALGTLRMELGDVRETISVTAEATPVQLASAEKSGTITSTQINNIAVKGRDFMSLLLTVPGVVDNFSQPRETMTPDALRGTYINGGRESQKNFSVDGVTDMDTGCNCVVHYEPNMDSISEVKVMTSNYQAEFGRNSGGAITVITKSGTSSFHGTGYDYYRHESLNANNFFNNRTGTAKQPYRYRISGYSLGGPVTIPGKFNRNRDKLFFFWSQEFTGQKKNYGASFVNMPTELERNGDFSRSFDVNGALIPVKDPLTGQPFPGNIVPPSRINTLGQSILNYFPKPNYTDPDPRNLYRWNYRSVYSGDYPMRQEMIRVDANVSPTVQVFYRFVNSTDKQIAPYGLWINGSVNYNASPVEYRQPGRGHIARVSKTFSPTLMNEFTFGWSRNFPQLDFTDPEQMDRSRMGNPPQWYKTATEKDNYVPSVVFGGQPVNPVNLQLQSLVPANWHNDLYSFVDNVSKVWRSHSFKTGIYVEYSAIADFSYSQNRGVFNFGRDTNSAFDTNNAFSNALLGTLTSYSETSTRVFPDLRFRNIEWYVQDNWRVTPRLTLDLGVRFYHVAPQYDVNHTMATFFPQYYDPSKAPALYVPALDASGKRVAKNPLTAQLAIAPLIGQFVPGSGDFANGMRVAGRNGTPEGMYTVPWLALGPRFGFAYDLLGNGKAALRGGFGVFKDRSQGNLPIAMSGNPPVSYTPVLSYGNLETFAQAGGAIGPSTVQGITGEQSLPTTMNYSLGIQYQVLKTTIDASYVGGLSRHLWVSQQANPIPMYSRFDPANWDPTRNTPLPDNFFRTIKGVGPIVRQSFTSNSNYNALQLSVSRRLTSGLQFGIAYTFSKALGMGSSDNSAMSSYFNLRSYNYGPLDQNRPHVFVANYVYDLPKVGQRMGWKPVGWVLDNWQVSGMTSFMTGAPFTPGFSTTDGQDITGSQDGARITVVGNPRLDKSEKTFYRNFDTSVFRRTPQGSFGNIGLNVLYGPGVNNWDIAVSKRVPLGTEERFLQFRTEMFNAWNHTQFSGLYTGARFDKAGNQVDPNFGAFSAARNPRIIQLSLKLYF